MMSLISSNNRTTRDAAIAACSSVEVNTSRHELGQGAWLRDWLTVQTTKSRFSCTQIAVSPPANNFSVSVNGLAAVRKLLVFLPISYPSCQLPDVFCGYFTRSYRHMSDHDKQTPSSPANFRDTAFLSYKTIPKQQLNSDKILLRSRIHTSFWLTCFPKTT